MTVPLHCPRSRSCSSSSSKRSRLLDIVVHKLRRKPRKCCTIAFPNVERAASGGVAHVERRAVRQGVDAWVNDKRLECRHGQAARENLVIQRLVERPYEGAATPQQLDICWQLFGRDGSQHLADRYASPDLS